MTITIAQVNRKRDELKSAKKQFEEYEWEEKSIQKSLKTHGVKSISDAEKKVKAMQDKVKRIDKRIDDSVVKLSEKHGVVI